MNEEDDEYVSEEDDIPCNNSEILDEPDAPAESADEEPDELSDDGEDDLDTTLFMVNEDPYVSRNGKHNWERFPPDTGKTREANKMTGKPGVQSHAATLVTSLRESFDLFFTREMRAVVLRFTNIEGEDLYKTEWKELTTSELDAYFGLLLLQGVFKDSTVSIKGT
jgi:hypothetical protein